MLHNRSAPRVGRLDVSDVAPCAADAKHPNSCTHSEDDPPPRPCRHRSNRDGELIIALTSGSIFTVKLPVSEPLQITGPLLFGRIRLG